MLNPFQRIASIPLIASILLIGSACTAARTGLQLQAAVDAKALALEKRAPELAPYEYSMAEHYLVKAWEEAGHGEHKSSVQLAKKSIEWNDHAMVEIGKGPRRLDIETDPIKDPPTSTPRALPETHSEPQPLDSPDDIVLEGL